MFIEINGIQVAVTKKAIKNMHLYVKSPDGHVEVSAPLMMSDEIIKMFINTKLDWIKKQQHKCTLVPLRPEQNFVSGEIMYVFGKSYLLQVDYSDKRNSFSLDNGIALLNVRKGSTTLQRRNYINEWYRNILKLEIERVIPKLEELTGLYCSSWQTKNMITRWGTCNVVTRKIWLNLQLATKSFDCLEYVILHELAHLKEKYHNAKFTAIMDRYMPSWRDVQKKLNTPIV